MTSKTIAVIDSETDPFKKGRVPKPFLWGFYDGLTYKQFTKTIDLIKFLIDKPLLVYAHNGGKFDYHFLLDYIAPWENLKIINGRIAEFKIGECTFRDSFNILPIPLAAYQKTEIDYALFEVEERDKPENKKLIGDYLCDDCVFLYDLVMEFINRFGCNMTLAGTAMKQWIEISGEEAPKDDGSLYEYFADYYYGGRCQSFEYGTFKGDFKMADINSAYPYAMLSPHPYSLTFQEYTGTEILGLPRDIIEGSLIRLRCVSRGALPFRGNDGSLYFPDDYVVREYTVTGWEYLAGIDTDTLEEIEPISLFQFEDKRSFGLYIKHFYEERRRAKKEGDKAGDIFCKLLMNSLYGKFGSNPDTYKNFMTAPHDTVDESGAVEINGDDWAFSGFFGTGILLDKELPEYQQRFYNIVTAASITGYVRAFMWRAICNCERPMYCDTDSILAEDMGELPNGLGKELGQWDIEGHFNSLGLAGRKMYSLKKTDSGGFKTACKGVRLDPSEIYEVAKGQEILFEPENPTFSVHKEPRFTNRTVKLVQKTLQN